MNLITDQLSTDGLNTPNPNTIQPLAGNVALTVQLHNSNPGAGTINGSASTSVSVNIVPGTSGGPVAFAPLAVLSTTVSTTTPTGWTPPGSYFGINLAQVVINVQ